MVRRGATLAHSEGFGRGDPVGVSAAGSNGLSSVLVKLRADGRPDPTFGDGGVERFAAIQGFSHLRVLRDGSVLTFQYDALNRMIAKFVPERAGLTAAQTRDIYYDYDLRGLQTRARFDSLAGPGVARGWWGVAGTSGHSS